MHNTFKNNFNFKLIHYALMKKKFKIFRRLKTTTIFQKLRRKKNIRK